MSILASLGWGSPPAPDPFEPELTARPEDIAGYLYEMDANGVFDGHLNRGKALEYCRHRGHLKRPFFRFPELWEEVEVVRAKARRARLSPIRTDAEEWEGLRTWGRIPASVLRCPRHLWRMDKRTGHVYSVWADCKSYLCAARCAVDRAEKDLIWACRHFPKAGRIWVAIVPDDENLGERLRKRRERKRHANPDEGTVWVRRMNKDIHIFSTVDLSEPGGEPSGGDWMPSEDALELFVGATLALPGVKADRWAGSWKRATKRRAEAHSFNLMEGDDELMQIALYKARDLLTQQYGVNGLEQMSPENIEAIWFPMVQSAIQHQWDIRKSTS